MRDIKFRGKSINTGEWVYGYFKKNRHGDCYIEDEDGLAAAVLPETVGQRVCVIDEGDEVYEGDYINDSDDNFTMRVEWDDEEMQYVATEVYLTDEGWVADGDSFSLGEIAEMMSVGNIWDNEVEDFYKEATND